LAWRLDGETRSAFRPGFGPRASPRFPHSNREGVKNARQDKVRPVHNFKVHPDQIKQIGVGEALVFNKDKSNRVGVVKIRRAQR